MRQDQRAQSLAFGESSAAVALVMLAELGKIVESDMMLSTGIESWSASPRRVRLAGNRRRSLWWPPRIRFLPSLLQKSARRRSALSAFKSNSSRNYHYCLELLFHWPSRVSSFCRTFARGSSN
jgi:hypothetical protein